MTSIPMNLISTKSLEKQLKVVEGRMSELQAEMAELEKIKNACLVLMGTSPAVAESEESLATKAKKKKNDISVDAELVTNVGAEVMAGEANAEEPPTATH